MKSAGLDLWTLIITAVAVIGIVIALPQFLRRDASQRNRVALHAKRSPLTAFYGLLTALIALLSLIAFLIARAAG